MIDFFATMVVLCCDWKINTARSRLISKSCFNVLWLLTLILLLVVISYLWLFTYNQRKREAYFTTLTNFSLPSSLFVIFLLAWKFWKSPQQKQLIKRCKLLQNIHFESDVPLRQKLLLIDKYFPTLDQINVFEMKGSIKMERMLNEISKSLDDRERLDVTLVGSASERLNIPLSEISEWILGKAMATTHALLTDYDFMICNNLNQASFNRGKKYHITTEDAPLGFAKLFCNMTNSIVSPKNIKRKIYKSIMNMEFDDLPGFNNHSIFYCMIHGSILPMIICSCILSILRYLKFGFRITQTGPAIRIQRCDEDSSFLVDVTFYIKTIEWPTYSDWPTRTRKWPSEDIIDKVVREGFHLVPKSHPKDKEGVTWRFSFSKAEVTLLNLIEPTARKCFVSFKIIAKDFLIPCCKKLRTYYFKTIFMHVLEKNETNFWREDEIEKCFYCLIDHVIQAVKSRQCPHFWLSGVNLFEDLTDKDEKRLLKLLTKIKKGPSPYIDDEFFQEWRMKFFGFWISKIHLFSQKL